MYSNKRHKNFKKEFFVRKQRNKRSKKPKDDKDKGGGIGTAIVIGGKTYNGVIPPIRRNRYKIGRN